MKREVLNIEKGIRNKVDIIKFGLIYEVGFLEENERKWEINIWGDNWWEFLKIDKRIE